MYRKFIATISAAAIGLTALGSTPAAAGDRENARALAAILGIAAVGAIIHQQNKKDKKQVYSHRPAPVYQPPRQHAPAHNPPRYHAPQPRPLPKRVDRKLLPQECFRTYDTRRGRVAMFGSHCLQKNYQFANRLPQQCNLVVRTSQGDRRGYDARCLRDQGYRLARG